MKLVRFITEWRIIDAIAARLGSVTKLECQGRGFVAREEIIQFTKKTVGVFSPSRRNVFPPGESDDQKQSKQQLSSGKK